MAGSGHIRRKRQRGNSSTSEVLERRALLSCSAVNLDTGTGIVQVAGTTGDDVVLISTSEFDADGNPGASDFVHIEINSCVEAFADTDVVSIDHSADAGDDEFINETALPSIARGGGGSDTLIGGTAADSLVGGGGHDSLQGRTGNDTLGGNNGADTLEGGDGEDSLLGGNGQDLVQGNSGADYLDGEGGADTLEGGNGPDELLGGSGDDSLAGGAGHDILTGEDHNDTLRGGTGGDTLSSGAGDDVVYGGSHADLISGGDGANTLFGNAGTDSIYGGDHPDFIEGGEGNDQIFGGDGDNLIYGDAGADYIEGGEGNDTIYGGDQPDSVDGEGGDDLLYGEHGADIMDGDEGNDTVVGGDGADDLSGGEDDDSVVGGSGDDGLLGGPGLDTLTGGGHDDRFTHKGEDNLTDLTARDVEMLFIDSAGTTTTYDHDGDGTDDVITWSAGTWDYEEIGDIDFFAQRTMHRETGNTDLLDTPTGSSTFYRVSTPTDSTGASIPAEDVQISWIDAAGFAYFQDEAFAVDYFPQHFLHQFAHLWQDSSGDSSTWMSLSDWTLGSVVTGSRVLSGDGEWTYDPTVATALFVRDQGTFNPEDDFATVFAAYFIDAIDQGYDSGYEGDGATGIDTVDVDGVYDKLDYLTDFLATL